MLQTILVPLDGSPLSERALPPAIRLARAEGARLVLVRATLEFNGSLLSLVSNAYAYVAAVLREEDERRAVERDLARVADPIREDGLAVDLYARPGDPARVILDAARARRANLIVMATRGRGAPERWRHGSVADIVARQALAPVLLVPAACGRLWPEDRSPRILVPLDGSALAERALAGAERLGGTRGAELRLLRVVGSSSPDANMAALDGAAGLRGPEALDAKAYLEQHAAPLRIAGLSVGVRVVAAADPSAAIARVAREEEVDAIAMATRGHGGLTRLVLGSVAAEVLPRVTVPVLLARPAPRAGGRPARRQRPPDGGRPPSGGVTQG